MPRDTTVIQTNGFMYSKSVYKQKEDCTVCKSVFTSNANNFMYMYNASTTGQTQNHCLGI